MAFYLYFYYNHLSCNSKIRKLIEGKEIPIRYNIANVTPIVRFVTSVVRVGHSVISGRRRFPAPTGTVSGPHSCRASLCGNFPKSNLLSSFGHESGWLMIWPQAGPITIGTNRPREGNNWNVNGRKQRLVCNFFSQKFTDAEITCSVHLGAQDRTLCWQGPLAPRDWIIHTWGISDTTIFLL